MEIDVTPDLPDLNADIPILPDNPSSEENINVDNIPPKNAVDKDYTKHNKKVIKHALRQQAKRRRKNTTIASGNTSAVPRIIVKPLPPQPVEEISPVHNSTKTPTMREVLASIPGFSIKPRKRSNKKLSTAAQLEQTKEGCIDLETPDSILVNTSLRALLNKYTFSALPTLYQHKLVQLLPSVDRHILTNPTDSVRLSSSSLNNEFFARACVEWQERLGEGEFTPENQQKLKTEADKERSKLDPWKLKHFEPIWGDRGQADSCGSNSIMNSRPPIRTTIKLRPLASSNTRSKPPPVVKRLRTVGAMTRSCTNYNKEEVETKAQIPDLLPIRSTRLQKPEIVLTPSEPLEESLQLVPCDKNELDPLEIRDSIHIENNLSNLPEISIINISDSILNKNCETIITSRFAKTEKRQRSLSPDDEISLKRKTPIPVKSDLEIFAIPPQEIIEVSESDDSTHKEPIEDPLLKRDDQDLPEPIDIDEEIESELELEIEHDPEIYQESEMEQDNDGEVQSIIDEINEHEDEKKTENCDDYQHIELDVEIEPEAALPQDIAGEKDVDVADDCQPDTIEIQLQGESEVESVLELDQEVAIESHPELEAEPVEEEETKETAEELYVSQEQPMAIEESQHGKEDICSMSTDDVYKEEEKSMDIENIQSVDTPETLSEDLKADADHNSTELNLVWEPSDVESEAQTPVDNDNNESKDVPSEDVSNCSTKDDVTPEIPEDFPILPNTLILQQEPPVLKDDSRGNDYNVKLSCTVDESELVLSQLTGTTFHQEDEGTDNEDRFMDAETYVLESGQIPASTAAVKIEEKFPADIPAELFSVVDTAVENCWDVVDSSTEKLMEVPLHALDSVPVGMVGTENTTEHVEVIPMQEELEVRLEQGTFPVAAEWPYDVKIDPEIVVAALNTSDVPTSATENANQPPSYPEFQGNQVKLELEVTLTPEIVSSDSLVTSTVCASSNGSNSTVTPSISKGITTVIPPTTIVCLPSVVSTAPTTNHEAQTSTHITPNVALPRAGMVQSSSALPYIALSTSQPIRAVSTHSKVKQKNTQAASNRNRSSNKPPPGAVNLERSYQICQAVIQNSPNRDQLRCQLKPPPSLLAAVATNNAKKLENNRTQYGNVSSSRGNKTFTPPLPAAGNYNMIPGNNGIKLKSRPNNCQQQRQPSPPVVVRHVFTSGQGIPVTMAVLPQAQALSPEMVDGQNQMSHVGQYILVQRAGVGDPHVPRSSSAPPAQQQIGAISTSGGGGIVSLGGRGRPASVDADRPPPGGQQHQQPPPNEFLVQCPGTQAVTRRPPRLQHAAVVYGADVENNQHLQNYTIIGDGVVLDHPGAVMKLKKGDPCPCNLRAMVMCKKCGLFCHDDCVSPNKLCSTCFIR